MLSKLLWKLRGRSLDRKDRDQVFALLTMADTLLLGKSMREVLIRAKRYARGYDECGASLGARIMFLAVHSESLDEKRAWLAIVLLLRVLDGRLPTESQRRWVIDSARALVEGCYQDGRPLDFDLELNGYRMFL